MTGRTPASRAPLSPEKLAANRANATKSTGPRTAEGKAAASRNAFKHGLTGESLALPPELAAEVETRQKEYEAALAPRGRVERDLARGAARAAWRAERADRRELAAVAVRRARALLDHEGRKRAELAARIEALGQQPAEAVRLLAGSVAGCDWMIATWAQLEAALDRVGYWNAFERDQALRLLGKIPEPLAEDPVIRAVTMAYTGLLPKNYDLSHEVRSEHPSSCLARSPIRQATVLADARPEPAEARGMLRKIITAEQAWLREQRDRLVPVEELEARLAGEQAWVELGEEAAQARRYEAAAQRAWNQALTRLLAVRKAIEPPDPPITTPDPTPEPAPPPPPPPTTPAPAQNEPKPPPPGPDSAAAAARSTTPAQNEPKPPPPGPAPTGEVRPRPPAKTAPHRDNAVPADRPTGPPRAAGPPRAPQHRERAAGERPRPSRTSPRCTSAPPGTVSAPDRNGPARCGTPPRDPPIAAPSRPARHTGPVRSPRASSRHSGIPPSAFLPA
jgi:hypothetical protein